MAILEGVETRITATETGKALQEYNSPRENADLGENAIEKYIEAETGMKFQIEVYLPKDFKLHGAWGVGVSVDIDGGVVSQLTAYSRTRVKERIKRGTPFIDSYAELCEGSRYINLDLAFGSLDIS